MEAEQTFVARPGPRVTDRHRVGSRQRLYRRGPRDCPSQLGRKSSGGQTGPAPGLSSEHMDPTFSESVVGPFLRVAATGSFPRDRQIARRRAWRSRPRRINSGREPDTRARPMPNGFCIRKEPTRRPVIRPPNRPDQNPGFRDKKYSLNYWSIKVNDRP